jgi:hypothetical protein
MIKSVYISCVIIMSYSLQPNGVTKYDTVSKEHPKFHITMFSTKQFFKEEIIETDFEMNIPDSLISK